MPKLEAVTPKVHKSRLCLNSKQHECSCNCGIWKFLPKIAEVPILEEVTPKMHIFRLCLHSRYHKFSCHCGIWKKFRGLTSPPPPTCNYNQFLASFPYREFLAPGGSLSLPPHLRKCLPMKIENLYFFCPPFLGA